MRNDRPEETSSLLRTFFALCLAATTSAAWGCKDDQPVTQLVVVVDSDYRSEVELARIDVNASSRFGDQALHFEVLSKASKNPADDEVTLPVSFAVVPPNGDANAKITFDFEGRGPKGTLLVRRRVRVGFVENESRVLRVTLEHACNAVYESCETKQQTCIAGGCATIDIDVRKLDVAKPGTEIKRKLDAWCEGASCEDAGTRDSGTNEDAASMLENDAEMDGAGSDAGDADLDSSIDAMDASDADIDANDGSMEPAACSEQGDFFSEVGLSITTSHDGLCPMIAGGDYQPTHSNPIYQNAIDLLSKGVNGGHDFVELQIAYDQAQNKFFIADGSTKVATTKQLDGVLMQGTLNNNATLVMLTLVNTDGNSTTFATKLLDFLLDYDSDVGSVNQLAKRCRPMYINATTAVLGNDSYDAARSIKSQLALPKYASLRDHLRFGAEISDQNLTQMKSKIDRVALDGMHFVQLDARGNSIWQGLRYARSEKELGAMLFGVDAPELGSVFCGNHEGFIDYTYMHGFIDVESQIHQSRRMLDVDLAAHALGSNIKYYAQANGGIVIDMLNASDEPVLTTGPTSFSGTSLSFTPAMSQRFMLDGTEGTDIPERFGVFVVARLHDSDIASGERQVLVSKRQGSSGWALELINDGSGTALRFSVYIDNGTTIQAASVQISPPVANQSAAIFAQMLMGTQTKLYIRVGPTTEYSLFGDIGTTVNNTAKITLGSDPNATKDFLDGDVQLVRLLSL